MLLKKAARPKATANLNKRFLIINGKLEILLRYIISFKCGIQPQLQHTESLIRSNLRSGFLYKVLFSIRIKSVMNKTCIATMLAIRLLNTLD
jgi:hypothetical protein